MSYKIHYCSSLSHGITIGIWDREFGTFVKADMLEVYSLEKKWRDI